MPIQFTVGEAVELLRYGKFTLLSLNGEIPAAEAEKITKTPWVTDPPVEAIYHVADGWMVLTERFNWGETTRPDKVYYELHQYGKKVSDYLSEYGTLATAFREGFYCGSMIRGSNLNNVCTHIFASDKIHVKLWNATGDAPQDVYYDFTVWYYTFMESYFRQVMDILLRTDRLLEEILKKPVEYPVVDLSKVEVLLGEIKAQLERRRN